MLGADGRLDPEAFYRGFVLPHSGGQTDVGTRTVVVTAHDRP
jgi:hypothetical protein